VTVAALVISIVALFVAGLSALFTRQQAAAAEGSRRIEAGRRHQELCPVLKVEYVGEVDTRDGTRPGIKFTNEGPLDLERIEISLVPPHRLNEAVINGIYDAGSGGTKPVEETGLMRRGESWMVGVVPTTDKVDSEELARGGNVKFRCICYADGYDSWVVIASVDVPGTPFVLWA